MKNHFKTDINYLDGLLGGLSFLIINRHLCFYTFLYKAFLFQSVKQHGIRPEWIWNVVATVYIPPEETSCGHTDLIIPIRKIVIRIYFIDVCVNSGFVQCLLWLPVLHTSSM